MTNSSTLMTKSDLSTFKAPGFSWNNIQINNNILRAETAAISAISIINYLIDL